MLGQNFYSLPPYTLKFYTQILPDVEILTFILDKTFTYGNKLLFWYKTFK